MNICIVGDPTDLTAIYVAWLARRRGLSVLELPESTLGVDWTFAFDDSRAREGHVECGGQRYPFSALAGAYVRLHPHPPVPPDLDLDAAGEAVLVTERRGGLLYFLNSLPLVVANRPHAGRSNGSKPHQMRLLARAGFAVPEWVATNDAEVASAFAGRCTDGAIYKACSGLRSTVRLFDEAILGRLGEGSSPIVVQEYVRGREVRVHVVGRQIFATEIHASGIDYRFDSTESEFCASAVPVWLEERCRAFAAEEGLLIAGFDFRIAGDGRWYCLEMNPVPTFLPYAMATGQAIGEALLDELVAG
jgi:hypothetical protein